MGKGWQFLINGTYSSGKSKAAAIILPPARMAKLLYAFDKCTRRFSSLFRNAPGKSFIRTRKCNLGVTERLCVVAESRPTSRCAAWGMT